MENTSTEPTGGRRIKPNHVVVALGVAIGLFTLASGIVPLFEHHWIDKSGIQREVFGGIPGPFKLVFYTVIPVILVYGAVLFSYRVKNWGRGAPDNRATTKANIGRRLKDFRAGAYMQTLLRDPAAGIMHSLIYFSFLVLLAVTTVLEINHQLPVSAKFLHGAVYEGYSFVGDVAGLAFLAGIVWAIMRRYVAAALPHPHQDQARARADPRHVPGHRRHRLPHRDVPHRRDGAAGVREVVGRRLPAVGPRQERAQRRRLAPGHVGAARRRLHPLPGDPARHDAAPHVHVAAQHVPARP